MEWSTFHRYRNLVNEGKAREILCPEDGAGLISRIHGKDDDPHFWCPACEAFTKPGLNVYSQMQAVVSEHFME